MSKVTLEEALELIDELVAHLEYCGWGDSWERECAEPLMKQVEEFNDKRGRKWLATN